MGCAHQPQRHGLVNTVAKFFFGVVDTPEGALVPERLRQVPVVADPHAFTARVCQDMAGLELFRPRGPCTCCRACNSAKDIARAHVRRCRGVLPGCSRSALSSDANTRPLSDAGNRGAFHQGDPGERQPLLGGIPDGKGEHPLSRSRQPVPHCMNA